MSNWMNEAGEPYMTAAALRFEAELDEQSAYERQYDDMYDNEPNEDEWDECDVCESEYGLSVVTGVCADCGAGQGDVHEEVWPMEDQWLDGSYEE